MAGQAARKRLKRLADPPSDTDEFKSEHEHHPDRSNSKRARENTPSDNDLSLQNSSLSNHRQPAKCGKLPPWILPDIANGFEDDDPTGDKIMQQLADIATKRCGKKLSSDKLKTLLDTY